MQIISTTQKNEQHIYKEIGDVLSAYLQTFGYIQQISDSNYAFSNGVLGLANNSGELKALYLKNTPARIAISNTDINSLTWQIRQWAQPSMQKLVNNSIFMNFFSGRRYGWISTKYNWDKEAQKGYVKIEWRRDIHFTFTFFKNRDDLLTTRGEDYLSSEDMARNIFTWIQSDLGLEALRAKGYWILPPTQILNPELVLPTEQFERTPNFSMTLVIKEETVIDATENFISQTEEEIRQQIGLIEISRINRQ